MIKVNLSLFILFFFIFSVCAINPLHTTYFLYVRHTLERQTWCRSYPEPTMNNLIKNINSFFEVADLNRHGLNNTIRFLKEYACTLDSAKEFSVTYVNTSRLAASKEARCATMYTILDVIYDDMREVSYLHSNKSFDPMQLKYPKDKEPTIREIKDNPNRDSKLELPLHEFFVALWIRSDVYYEEMCEVTKPIIEHLEILLSKKLSRSLEITEDVPVQCDKFNVLAEVILSFIPRIYLDFKARLGQFWMTIKSDLKELAKLIMIQFVKTFDHGLQSFGYNLTNIELNSLKGKFQALRELRRSYYPYDNHNVTLF